MVFAKYRLQYLIFVFWMIKVLFCFAIMLQNILIYEFFHSLLTAYFETNWMLKFFVFLLWVKKKIQQDYVYYKI